MLRKLAYFIVVGFLAVTLAGPVITLLTFAFVGLILYSLFQVLSMRNPETFQRMKALTKGLYQTLLHTARWMAIQVVEVFRWGFTHGGPAVRKIGHVAHELGTAATHKAQTKGRALADVLLETLSGAGVGAMLGAAVYMAQPHFWMDAAIPIGGGLGAFLGLIVGITRLQRAVEPTERPA